MVDSLKPKPYTLTNEEKVTLMMVYTPTMLVRGEVVTKQILRVSTWMRTQAAPEYMRLYNAQILMVNTQPMQSITMVECHIPAVQISAYHIAPPNAEPLDFDASEPNRKMEPALVQLGAFRFKGCLRLASQSNLAKFLETARENFFSFYDVEVSNPLLPAMGSMRLPYAALRTNAVVFGQI